MNTETEVLTRLGNESTNRSETCVSNTSFYAIVFLLLTAAKPLLESQ